MGWFDRSHVSSTFWSSSYLILVTGGLVVPLSRQFIQAFHWQVLALGFMVGCTFAPNLKTFTGENILGFSLSGCIFWHLDSYALLNSFFWVTESRSLPYDLLIFVSVLSHRWQYVSNFSSIMYHNSDYLSRDSMLWQMCTHSTSKLGRYSPLSLNVIGLELTTSID